jgi:hypothetical protein
MLKRLLIAWVSCALLLTLLPAAASAAKGNVQVHIANFPVKVNGQLFNNHLSKYPFLVYMNITYVPLDTGMVHELGLILNWSKADGLQINSNCCIDAFQALKKKQYSQNLTEKNSTNRSYTAMISTYKIQLNGEMVKNSEQVYPFLEFRNVKYIPLTWLNAHTMLHMDLQWNEIEGFALWSGQSKVLDQIVYDDDEALYLNASGIDYKTHDMLKIAKSLKAAPIWLNKEQANAIRDKADQAARDQVNEGEKVIIERINNVLTYQGLELAALRDEDRQEVEGKPLSIEGTLYHIDDRRSLLVVYTYFPTGGIGPPPLNLIQLFTLVDGKVKTNTKFPFLPERVIKNADGTVWIARDREPAFRFFYTGSGVLAIMDQEGNVRVANDVWNKMDVSPIGITSPNSNPADKNGQMVVRLYGEPQKDPNGRSYIDDGFIYTYKPEDDTYFLVDTALSLKRLPHATDSMDNLRMYKDNHGDLYTINLNSNTITNWTQNRYRTWTDKELLKNS